MRACLFRSFANLSSFGSRITRRASRRVVGSVIGSVGSRYAHTRADITRERKTKKKKKKRGRKKRIACPRKGDSNRRCAPFERRAARGRSDFDSRENRRGRSRILYLGTRALFEARPKAARREFSDVTLHVCSRVSPLLFEILHVGGSFRFSSPRGRRDKNVLSGLLSALLSTLTNELFTFTGANAQKLHKEHN